jgi:hypothetical protein
MSDRASMRRATCSGREMVEETGHAASITSEHPRLLKQAGLIDGEIERPRRWLHVLIVPPQRGPRTSEAGHVHF